MVLVADREGPVTAFLRDTPPPQINEAFLPGCPPSTHVDSAGLVPGWCQHQGKCSNRRLSAGHPLDSPEHWEDKREISSVLDLAGPSLPSCPPACQALLTGARSSPCLCFSQLLSRCSQGCHTKSALWGSAAARARSLIVGISAWNRVPTLIRLQRQKG